MGQEATWDASAIYAWLRVHSRWLVTLEGDEYVSRQWIYLPDEKTAPENDSQTLKATSLEFLREAINERYGYLGDLVCEPPEGDDASGVVEIWRVVERKHRH